MVTKYFEKLKLEERIVLFGTANVAFCEEGNLNFYNLNNCDEKRRR